MPSAVTSPVSIAALETSRSEATESLVNSPLHATVSVVQTAAKHGLVGLRSVPGRIRALAKAIHDDTQFEELRQPNTGELRMPTAMQILQDMGADLTLDEMTLFDVAISEYAQQLQGVNPNLVKREAISNVLTLTASIDGEAAFAGVSVPNTMDAVVRTHAVYMKYITTVLPRSGVPAFTALSEAIIEQLKPLDDKVRAVAGRRSNRFRPAELTVVRTANGRLRAIVRVLEEFVPAMLQTVLFDAHTVVVDHAAQVVWDRVAGRSVPVISRLKAAQLFSDAPPTIVEALLKILDVGVTGFVSVFSFAEVTQIWGPYVVLPLNFYRDVLTGNFILDYCAEEARLHLTGSSTLYEPDLCGDRRRWADAASVKGSVASAKAAAERQELLTPTPGNFCIAFGREAGTLVVAVLDGELQVRTFDLLRDRGAWKVCGLSQEHFESIRDAIEAYPTVFRRSVGFDADIQWFPDVSAPMETSCHALHRACFCNNLPFVKHLLDSGNDVVVNIAMADSALVPSEFMWPPLLYAVNSPTGDPSDVVECLIQHGADVAFKDEAGCTALYYAIALGYVRTVKLLLEADPDLVSSDTTHRALMALGAHHYIAQEPDVRRLSEAAMVPDIVELVLVREYDMDFVLLCSAIVDGKIKGEALRPEDDRDRASSAPQLRHLRDRSIVTLDQQREIDDLVEAHTAAALRSGVVNQVQRKIQHRLFKLSVDRLLGVVRGTNAVSVPAPILEVSPSGDMLHVSAGETNKSSAPESPGAASDSPATSPALRARTDSQQLPFDFWRGGRRISEAGDQTVSPSGSVSMSPSPDAEAVRRRRLSSIALGVFDADVLKTSFELVATRRKYSVSTTAIHHDDSGRNTADEHRGRRASAAYRTEIHPQ